VDELLVRAAGALETLLYVLAAVAGIGFLLLGWRLFRHPASRAVSHTARDLALACAFALVVVMTLLTPTPIGDGLEPEFRLVPFQDLRDALDGTRSLSLAVAEIAGNVALFVPLGIAIRWRFPWLGVLAIGLATLALSAAIEGLQALTGGGRWPDTTDVITNTVGGLIGAVLGGIGAVAERRR
jgi:glycopeptide antibiotics resistance protein